MPPIPTTAQSRMSRPAHSPAGIAAHQSPTAQDLRGSRGPLAGEPEGSCRGSQRRGRDLASTFPGPFVSPSRANLRASIVRTARRSAGVAVRNRMTWVFFQRLCVRVFVAHGREDTPPRPQPWNGAPVGSVRLGRRGRRVTKSCRDRHGATWRRTYLHSRYIEALVPCRAVTGRSGLVHWPLSLAEVGSTTACEMGIHSVGGGDLCDFVGLLAACPLTLSRGREPVLALLGTLN